MAGIKKILLVVALLCLVAAANDYAKKRRGMVIKCAAVYPTLAAQPMTNEAFVDTCKRRLLP